MTRWYRFAILICWMLCPALAAAQNAPSARRVISLDGTWQFATDPSGTLTVEQLGSLTPTRAATVPGSWQSEFDDLRDYAGVAWYWRSVARPETAPGDIILLHFGAVDYRATVYVNGKKAGEHDGGYLPFEFDVTPLMRAGANEIALLVADPGAKPDEVEGIRYGEIPHGKQSWYVQTSGPWQSVEFDIVPRGHCKSLHVRGSADGKFLVEIALAAAAIEPLRLEARIVSPSGEVVWKRSDGLRAGETAVTLSGALPHAALWSPDHPQLYALSATLSSGDRVTTHFGFRTFETRGGKFYLNGKAIYLRGALDQDFYPQTVYTPPSLDYIKDEMRKAKALGLNLLRCHIKVPDPRYLEAADEVGMLVWYEIPSWGKLTPDSERRALETLRGMAERDWNHPCLVIVSLINESWGIDLKQAADRAWLKRTHREAKSIVPGWLVDDNSACCDNFHLSTDLADFHAYNAIPDHADDFDRFVGDLARRPKWLFSPYGDAEPRGDEPLVLSEFGNWGLPQVPTPRPWWFARDFGGNKLTLPAGFARRLANYGFQSLFGSLDALSRATEEHEFQALRYEITALRSRAPIQGYVITEFTDINWESNGLLDMWRRPKVFGKELSAIQQDDWIGVRAEIRNFYSGAAASAEVYVSNYGPKSLDHARVAWQVQGTTLGGEFDLPAVSSGAAFRAGRINFTVPAVQSPGNHTLKVRILSGGQVAAQNSLDLFFYPRQTRKLPPAVAFYDPQGALRRLADEMRKRHYAAPSGAFPVTITSTFDASVRKKLEAGGRVILLSNGPQTIAPGVEVVPRQGELGGDWISDFPWVRRASVVFKRIGFSTIQGFESQSVTPQAVVRGVPPSHYDDVLAGLFYGWIHSSVGTLVEARYGKGKLIICTFNLASAYSTDPYATYLLDALVRYAASDFAPRYSIGD